MKRTNEAKSPNSSIDSIGEDLSFDDSDKPKGRMTSWPEDEYIDYKTLKNKRETYLTGKAAIIKKKVNEETEELENNGWSSIFATFFNNRKKDSISLNELDLRCRYSSKCDEIEKQMRKSKKGSVATTTQSFPPHANLKEFIDKISVITSDTSNKLSMRKSMELIMAKQSMQLASRKHPTVIPKKGIEKEINSRKSVKENTLRSSNTMTMVPFLNKASASKKFGSEAEYKYNSRRDDSKLRNSKTTNELSMTPPEITKQEVSFHNENSNNRAMIPRRTSNLLELYEIKDAPVILKSVIKINLKSAKKTPKKNNLIPSDSVLNMPTPSHMNKHNTKSSKFDEENFNHLLANKNSFNVELDRYSTILKRKIGSIKGNSLLEYKHLLDFKDSELFFEVVSVKNGSMIKRYKDESAKIDKISKIVEKFERTVCSKFDPTKKIQI